MITNISIKEAEKKLGRPIQNISHNKLKLLWTDYEDTNLIINLLYNCENILELGTYKGNTTQNIANNVSVCEQLHTVDIVKEMDVNITSIQKNELLEKRESGIFATNKKIKKILSTTDNFFIKNKIKFDGIFIDASHEYHQVLRDTNNAIKCLNPGGIIVWHDVYNLDKKCSKSLCEPNNDGVVKALKKIKQNVYKIDRSWVAFMKQ